MNTLHYKTGFTFVEILFVISIVGIMVAIGFISVQNATSEAALDNSYATVITTLESARKKAMQGAGNGTDGQSVTIDSSGESIVSETGATIPLAPNVTINNTGNTITFNRISGETSPITLVLTEAGGETKTIELTGQGYVK